MNSKRFQRYYLFSCIGVLIASYYPLSMGVRVIRDMIVDGTVFKENYPKYIIPYTPMCIAVIAAVFLMPLCIRLFKKFALVGGASIAAGVFFAVEFLFERKVVVSTAETVTRLEDWQMFMCYVPPQGWGETVTTYKTQTAVDILMGDYNPAFKLHFYMISVVLVFTILNCLYGFGHMAMTGEKRRLKSLILQSVCSLTFLGLCILACFTAFWRDGSIEVSPLSAALMAVFFVFFGVTTGVFAGSFLLGKRKFVSVLIPSLTASVMTLFMYIGEMILLNGHLYRFGTGVIFNSISGIVFAPIDLFLIVASGGITAGIFILLNGGQKNLRRGDKMKKKDIAVLTVLALLILAAIAFGGNQIIRATGNCGTTNPGGADGTQSAHSAVQLLEKISDTEESSYRVGAALPAADLSSVGQVLSDRIAQEWDTYDRMTEEQRLASSKFWGNVYIQTDTWGECEEAIGFDVDNPLESLDWLVREAYFGRGSSGSDTSKAHAQAVAYATRNTDTTVHNIRITADYRLGSVPITLTATISADAGYSTGCVCNGYASYEERTVAAGSGIPVLIVTTDEANNKGYYNGDYFDPSAYWVKDHAFYELRVFGEETDKEEIQTVLDRILAEI